LQQCGDEPLPGEIKDICSQLPGHDPLHQPGLEAIGQDDVFLPQALEEQQGLLGRGQSGQASGAILQVLLDSLSLLFFQEVFDEESEIGLGVFAVSDNHRV